MVRTSNIRKDFLLERYSIISEKRGQRPHAYAAPPEKKGHTCFFCPGNESMTPPTIDAYPDTKSKQWSIRVFRNKFPALKPPEGDHEIIVDTAKHGAELEDLSPDEILQVFLMYEKRRKVLLKKYKHVSVFKNSGPGAGASIAHAHTQILAESFVPTIVADEAKAAKSYYSKKYRCPWCDYIARTGAKGVEKKRVALKTEHSIAITANAPRFPYEVWLMPRRHVADFSSLTSDEALDFCAALKELLAKASSIGPYNFVLHQAPKGASKYYHFHLELMPRVSKHAGYELGEGVFIIIASPETAAKFYKSKSAQGPVPG